MYPAASQRVGGTSCERSTVKGVATQVADGLGAGLLSRADVCERLRISERTLDRIVARGDLHPVRAGRRPRFLRGDLERYIARPLEDGASEATPPATGPSEPYHGLATYVCTSGWRQTDEAVAEVFAQAERRSGSVLTPAQRSALHRLLENVRAHERGDAS